METNKSLIDDRIQKQISSKLKQIDARVFVTMYLYAHPETTQAQMAKEFFHVAPASFSAALGRNEDECREDWQPIIANLLEDSDFRDFKRRSQIVLDVSDYLILQKRRNAVRQWALKFLKSESASQPEEYDRRIVDNRCLVFRDKPTKRQWVFIIADDDIDANADPISHARLFAHYSRGFTSNDTLYLVTSNAHHIYTYIESAADGVKSVGDIKDPKQAILQVSSDFSEIVFAYELLQEDWGE